MVKAYDYWWGYTCAQIELMLADTPIVIYKKDKADKKHTKKELDELTRRWKEKKEKDAKEGKTVNLNDFIRKDK